MMTKKMSCGLMMEGEAEFQEPIRSLRISIAPNDMNTQKSGGEPLRLSLQHTYNHTDIHAYKHNTYVHIMRRDEF